MNSITKIFGVEGMVHYSQKFTFGNSTGVEGVLESDGEFYAYVKNGWGMGGISKPHPDQQTAMADIVRLKRKHFK